MNKIIEKIGLPACLEQLAEKCSELSKAALKLARIQRGENPTAGALQETLNNLERGMIDLRSCISILSDYLYLKNVLSQQNTYIQSPPYVQQIQSCCCDFVSEKMTDKL